MIRKISSIKPGQPRDELQWEEDEEEIVFC